MILIVHSTAGSDATIFQFPPLEQLDNTCADNVKVDTRLTVIREVHARWINELLTYLKDRPDDIKKGFEKAGITAACRADFVVDENPFSDLV